MGSSASKASKSDLPIDIIRVILNFVEISDIITCTTVNKQWLVATNDWQVWKNVYAQASFLENLSPALAASTELSTWKKSCLKLHGKSKNLPRCKKFQFSWRSTVSRDCTEITWCHGQPWILNEFENRLCIYQVECQFGKEHPQTLWASDILPGSATFLGRDRVMWSQLDANDASVQNLFIATLPPANAPRNLMEVSKGGPLLFSRETTIVSHAETPSGGMLFFVSDIGRIFAMDPVSHGVKWTQTFDATRSQIICASASESTLVVMSQLKSVDDRVDLHFFSVETGSKRHTLPKLPGRDNSRVFFVDDATCALIGSQNITFYDVGIWTPRVEAKLPVSIYSKRVARVRDFIFVISWDSWNTYDATASVWRILHEQAGPEARKTKLEIVTQFTAVMSRPSLALFITDELEMYSINSVPRQTYLELQKMSFVPE